MFPINWYIFEQRKTQEMARELSTEVLQAYVDGYEQNTNIIVRGLKAFFVFPLNPKVPAYRHVLKERLNEPEKGLVLLAQGNFD